MRTADVCPTCSTYYNALCVIFDGPLLETLDINPEDSVDAALIKIEAWAAGIDILADGGVTELSDLTDVNAAVGSPTLNDIMQYNGTTWTLAQLPQLEWSTYTGTRAGGDLNLLLGDFDASGNGTLIDLNDNTQTIKFVGSEIISEGHFRIENGFTLRFESGAFVTTVSSVALSANYSIQFPAQSGTVALSENYTSLFPITTANTGTVISLESVGGNYCNMLSANPTTTYTLSNTGVLGGKAKVLINAPSQPSVTGANIITGDTFIADTNMYLIVENNGGGVIDFYFLEI